MIGATTPEVDPALEGLRAELDLLRRERAALQERIEVLSNIDARWQYRVIPYYVTPLGTLLASIASALIAAWIGVWQGRVADEQNQRAQAEQQRAQLQGIADFLEAFDEENERSWARRVIAIRVIRRMVDNETAQELLAGIPEELLVAEPTLIAEVEKATQAPSEPPPPMAPAAPTDAPVTTTSLSKANLPNAFFSDDKATRLRAYGDVVPERTSDVKLVGDLCRAALRHRRNAAAVWNATQLIARVPATVLEQVANECRLSVCDAQSVLTGPRGQDLLDRVKPRIETASGSKIQWQAEHCPPSTAVSAEKGTKGPAAGN